MFSLVAIDFNIFRPQMEIPRENLYMCNYAQNLILVNLILVNFGGFLVIARNPTNEF